MRNPNSKKLMFFGAILLVFFILAIVYLAISNIKTSEPPAGTEKTPPKNVALVLDSTTPPVEEGLTPGQNIGVTLMFKGGIDPKSFTTTIYSSPITDEKNRTRVKNTESNAELTKKITISTVEPLSIYTIFLTGPQNNTFELSYISASVTPTAVPTNNLSLSSYLPYSEPGFSMEFFETRNIYIVHFKYDPGSSLSLDNQMADVKQRVENFIRSKGIDPASVTLEYSNK